MATADTLAQLKSRILSHFSMMFLSTWEEERWETELAADGWHAMTNGKGVGRSR